jgi:predicted amidohydrolase
LVEQTRTGGSPMKVSLVSCRTRSDPTQTLADLRETVRSAARARCHLVCYPEFLIGGLPTGSYDSDRPHAVTRGGPFLKALSQLAREHSLSIAAGLLEEKEDILYDSAVLVSAAGELDLHYRRISPTWKPPWAPSSRYREGSMYQTARLQDRAIGFALCGDLFHEAALQHLPSSALNLLIVPLFRGYDEDCPNATTWGEAEKYVYARQIAAWGVTALVINAYADQEPDTAFGGSLCVSPAGEILAEGGIGRPGLLITELP